MSDQTFRDAKQTIQGTPYEATKLETAKTVLNSNCISVDQVMAI
jgi:hypothetical protein